ncbi:MAG: hypothetical protein L6V35_10375 [Alistipes putredinis]|nr:MAG: hypothetical protein L6V35_10375 [Alistipes putredinis]
MRSIYPDIDRIGSWWKSDEIEIKDIKRLKRKRIFLSLSIAASQMALGKAMSKEIMLFLRQGKEQGTNYIVYDSKKFRS